MLALILTAVAVWFSVHWLYVIAMAAKQAIVADRLTVYWWILLLPAAGLGVMLDFAFNYTFGFMFVAWPQPYLFSQTVQHHYSHSDGWRFGLACFFAEQLNVFDDHIK